MDILQRAHALQPYLIAQRRQLHRFPELSGNEYKTMEHIQRELDEIGIPNFRVEDGGVLGFIETAPGEKTVLLRAELDALPIQEAANNLKGPRQVISVVDGVAHMCGHDAHMAMLLGAAKLLYEDRKKLKGNVLFLFTQGAEGGGNMEIMFDYLIKNAIRIDGCWTLHLMPGQKSGEIGILPGAVLAGARSFNVVLVGKGGHGAIPDKANNPLDCFTAIYYNVNSLRARTISPKDDLTFSVGVVQTGSMQNVIPETLQFAGTIRSYDAEIANQFYEQMLTIIADTCKTYHCEAKVTSQGNTPPTINHPDVTQLACKAIDTYLPGLLAPVSPARQSDGFGRLLQTYPGCFTFLGTNNPAKGTGGENHTSQFDVDEEVMPLGVAANVVFATNFLKSKKNIQFLGQTASAIL